MDTYNVFTEFIDEGQFAIETIYILTQKPDGSIKTQLVAKGFQKQNEEQSDSPIAGRDTFKVFCSIAANEKWVVEGSDVRSVFLQSENIDCDVFIVSPAQRYKDGFLWKFKKNIIWLR